MGNVCWVDALLLTVIIFAYNVIKCDLCLTRLRLHFWIYFNCKSLRDITNLITVNSDTAYWLRGKSEEHFTIKTKKNRKKFGYSETIIPLTGAFLTA